MEAEVRVKRFGGSLGIILPRGLVERERIDVNDKLKVRVEKIVDLSFMWDKGKDVRKSTDRIMREIDEGEDE